VAFEESEDERPEVLAEFFPEVVVGVDTEGGSRGGLPRFRGHRSKKLFLLPRTQPVNDRRVWSDDVADCRTLRCIQRYPALRNVANVAIGRGSDGLAQAWQVVGLS